MILFYLFDVKFKIFLFQIVFPNPDNFPADFSIMPINFFVLFFVSFYFRRLMLFPRGRQTTMSLAPVPKTRVNKNRRFVFRQNDIRLAEILCRIFPVSKARFLNRFSKINFDLAVLAFNLGHYLASFLFLRSCSPY